VKLGEVFRFEVEYRLGRASTWIYAVVLVGIPFLMMHVPDGGTDLLNAPQMVAEFSIVIGILGMVVTAALFGDAATRDIQTGMHPLVYTSPIRTAEYLGGRFLGALAVNAVLLLGIPLGQWIGSLMPYMDPRMFGAPQTIAYIQPLLLFLLPNLLLTGAVLFTLAALTRSMLPAYVAAIGLFMGYVGVRDHLDRIANRTVAALVDPFGAGVIADVTRYWTPAETEARLIGFPELLLWNRLAWFAVAMAVLLVLHRRFRFTHPAGAGRRRGVKQAELDAVPERTGPVVVPVVARSFGWRTRVWQTLAVARRGVEEIAFSRTFLLILAAALVIVFTFGWQVGAVVFGTSTWPVTHLIAGTVLNVAVSLFAALLVALFAGELVWSEREVRVSAIADAAPVPDWVSLLGRFLALVAMLVVLQTVLMAAGMLLQTLQGYYRYEIGLYLRILFGIKLVDYVLLAALAMTVHVIVNQKYVGHVAVLLCILFTVFSGGLGIRHRLLIYGSDPGWLYSDMNGFGPFMGPWTWFKLYWAAWALLLAVAARLFWVRGREGPMRERVRTARARLTGSAARAAAVAVLLIATLGGFIFYNTNVLNDYRTPSGSAAQRAEYERKYRRYEALPQPRITRAELRVELYPEGPAADIRGSYRLVNRTAQPIRDVHVLVNPELRARSVAFDRGTRRTVDDARLQYQVYALDRPLAPGDSLRMTFDLGFRPRGFRNRGYPTEVVRNGSYIDRQWLPMIGYQPELELKDAAGREEHGLPTRPRSAPVDDPRGLAQRFYLRDADLVHVDAVVGTDGAQIAVSPGVLVRQWRAGGRRYFHYRTEAPVPFGVPILSAEYAVVQDEWRDVELQIFHHPTHTFNLQRIMRGMKASLEYGTANFGPYPYRRLQIVEFPRYASFARAHAHTIPFSEGSAFLTRVDSGDVDRPFFVTAHEAAHQWWGEAVSGAAVRGEALLTETLAQYTAMMVMEKTYGPEQVRRFYGYEMERYLEGRTFFTSREVPLLQVEDQRYLYYHKGAVVMYTLREHIGEARVNLALRRFLEKHRPGVPPFPTALDLYAELQAVTPDSVRPLLRDLFEEITLWDVEAREASASPAAGGGYDVTIHVRAAKVRADSVGNERAVPMDDWVEVGVFGAGEGEGEPLYLRRHRLRTGVQRIVVRVPREPARAGVDPYDKLIDRDRENNVVRVQVAPRAQPAASEVRRRGG
jgi:ABC-type transport system involved in multi-copper enzyme maturation permease subunit